MESRRAAGMVADRAVVLPVSEPVARAPRWTIHCDGTALPRGARAGLGAVLLGPDGERHTLSEVAVVAGRLGCANQAETLALIAALRAAARLGARAVDVRCDSAFVVTEARGARTQKEPLAGLTAESRRLLSGFEEAEVSWVPRRRNGEADALARGAVGLGPKGVVMRPRKGR